MRARRIVISKPHPAGASSSPFTGTYDKWEKPAETHVQHHHVHHHHYKDARGMGESAALSEVMEVLEDVPKTWDKHMSSHDGRLHIIKMEAQEAMEAYKVGDTKLLEQELEELAAACIFALEHMKG